MSSDDLSWIPAPVRDDNNCYAGTPESLGGWSYQLGYRPSLAAGVAFCTLFGIAVLVNLFQTIRKKRWTAGLLLMCAFTELLGWSGRTWLYVCPYNGNGYLLQIVTLIIAPVFGTAALYVLLGLLIKDFGPKSSILPAKWYTWIFLTADIVSLVIQAVGGAMASISSSNREDPKTGTDIMIGGVIFQLICMTAFFLFVVDFTRRVAKMGLRRNYVLTLVALYICFLFIYIRSVFRTIELSEGWSGYLMLHEGYFIGLDGVLMVVALYAFIPMDPAWLLPSAAELAVREAQHQEKNLEGDMNSDAGSVF